jgi:hypothetical protein
MHLYIPFLLNKTESSTTCDILSFWHPRQIKEVVEVDCDRQVGKYGLHDV